METCLTIARDIVAIITLPLILYRIWILKNSFSQDHERSRNNKAVELIQEWTKALNHKSSAARLIVEQLDNQQCVNLQKQEKVTILNNEKNRLLLKVIFNIEFKENGNIELDFDQASKLRWEIITYLNILESILVAYRHNVADQKIIKEQFRYLVKPSENHYILEEFRKASGDENYPGIRDFGAELAKDNNGTEKGKSKTGFLKFWKKNS